MFDRVNNAWIPVADLVNAVAVEVHETPALDVLDPNPLGVLEYVHARGGQRLMQEMLLVGVEEGAGFVVEMGLPPCSALWPEVDVTLGAIRYNGSGVDGHARGTLLWR